MFGGPFWVTAGQGSPIFAGLPLEVRGYSRGKPELPWHWVPKRELGNQKDGLELGNQRNVKPHTPSFRHALGRNPETPRSGFRPGSCRIDGTARRVLGCGYPRWQKLPYLETTRDIWENAGKISASLRGQGMAMPLSDLIIAATAMANGCEVFTVDPHFDHVQGLKRHHGERAEKA